MSPFAEEIQFQIGKLWQDSGLDSLFDKLKAADPNSEDKLKEALANTFQAAEERLEDGFQLRDVVPILSAALDDIMVVAEGLSGATGEEKMQFVTVMFTGLYNFIDKGADGTKNRIDLPYIPQIAEDFIEKRVLPVLIQFAVEAVVSTWNRQKSD